MATKPVHTRVNITGSGDLNMAFHVQGFKPSEKGLSFSSAQLLSSLSICAPDSVSRDRISE